MRKYVVLGCLLVFLLASCASSGTKSVSDTSASTPAGPRQGGMGVDKSYDTELAIMVKEVAPSFKQFTYNDAETGRTMVYNLYIPEGYDGSSAYPLVLFMPDASLVGRGASATLAQGWGGLIWATEEEQAKHPCFVLVPTFTGPDAATNDDYQVSDEAEATYRLLLSVLDTYKVDTDRVYTTGQSMGCMLSFYLNIAHPEMFAASIFVSGHWDPVSVGTLADKHFFYISSAADSKFAAKIDAVKENLSNNGAKIVEDEWSAKLSLDEQNALVEKMLAEGGNVNLIEFSPGSVVPEGMTETNPDFVEHMYAFDHAYMISAVRDWLFTQSK
jgi:predicted peptidase